MRVLVTGAAGRIGSNFYAGLAGEFTFRLADVSDRVLSMPSREDDEAITLDIADAEACRAACEGIDSVLHLAADPRPNADTASLLRNNIQGTSNVFKGALATSVTRVVFASSIWAVKGYADTWDVDTDRAPWPINLYGASKVFGEGWCATFGNSAPDRSAIAIRIGAYEAPRMHQPNIPEWDYASYVSVPDLNDLIVRSLTAELETSAVVHGISNNRKRTLSYQRTADLLGYAPTSDGYVLMESVRKG